MSFYDDASLVFLPSGGAGKDTKAYSIKPTDGSGDFTFSRGGNLTATRVDSNGLIEKGRENLLFQSNQFDTTWVTSGSPSLSSGQSGYDGSTNAWLYTNNGSEYIYQDETTNVATYSIFAKKGNGGIGDFVLLFTDGVGGRYFDLDNGVLGSEVLTGLIDSKIELVSGTTDWYRCSVTFASSTRVRVYASLADNDFTSVATIYIQDAQLEIGLTSTEYIESGATKGKAGLLEQEPRFDYSGGASCPSLLLEPSRTQLAKLSEYFEGWSDLSNITPTTNYTTSPEGLQNATRLQFTSNGYIYNSGAPTQVSGTEYTLTLYAKRNDSGTQSFGFFTNGSGSVDSAMALTSEWQRFTYTYTASNNSQLGLAGLSGADVSVYGFQVEQASYPTSYIPNHSGGSETRDADSCSGAGDASTFNDDEGVLYAEIAALANDGGIRYLSLSDGSSNNRVVILFDSTTDKIRAIVSSGGVKYFDDSTTSYDVLNYNKIAVRYKQDDFSLWVNGTNVASVSSGSSPIGLNELSYNLGGSNTIFSKSKQLIVFNSFLSDAECITLTS